MKHWTFIIALMLVVVPNPVNHVWAANAPGTLQQLKVQPPQISSVTLNPSTVTGGTTQVIGTVTLLQPASSGGVKVTFLSSNPAVAAVPPSVVVQPGAAAATFVVQTQPVAINPNIVNPNPPSVQISAQIGNAAPMIAQLTVLPPTLVGLAFNPASVGGGSGSTGTVTISGPAPSGGLVVMLSGKSTTPPSSTQLSGAARTLQNPVSVPSQATIAAGTTAISFPVTTKPVTAATAVQITAAWGVYVTKTATLTVRPAFVDSFSLPPYGGSNGEVLGGTPMTGAVILNGQAPPEGLTVQIQSGTAYGGTTGTFPQCGQSPTVPSTVKVADGSTSASLPITTYPGYGVYYLQTYRYANDYSNDSLVSAFIRVNLPAMTSNSPILPSSVTGGTPIQGTLQLTGPAMPANCGNRYFLASDKPNLAHVPPYVDVTPGTTQGTFPITTSAFPATAGPQTVTISVTGPFVESMPKLVELREAVSRS